MMKKNYEDLKKSYKNVTLVNLIDKNGTQKKMGKYFQKLHHRLGE